MGFIDWPARWHTPAIQERYGAAVNEKTVLYC